MCGMTHIAPMHSRDTRRTLYKISMEANSSTGCGYMHVWGEGEICGNGTDAGESKAKLLSFLSHFRVRWHNMWERESGGEWESGGGGEREREVEIFFLLIE